jgi:PAS domain S-box-containing protein
VENQTEMIVRWKPDGTRTFVNDAYLRTFGLTHEQAVSTPFLTLIVEQDQAAIQKKIGRLVSGSAHSETDIHRSVLPNGDIVWQEWTDTAILDVLGNLIEFQSVGRDITERKKQESELHAIVSLGVALRTAPTRANMLPVIVKQLIELLDCDSIAIEIIQEQTGEAVVEMAHGDWEYLVGARQEYGTGLNSIISRLDGGWNTFVCRCTTGCPGSIDRVHMDGQKNGDCRG